MNGRFRRKLIRDRNSPVAPGRSDKKLAPTIEDDPNIITVVDQNGNTGLIETEMIEKMNLTKIKRNQLRELQLD